MDSPISTSTKSRKKKTPRLHNCLQVSLLSGLAFINSGRGGCSLREIYAFIVENFEGFDIRIEAWKKSIRHSLCTHVEIYVKAAGEGNWMFRNQDLFYEKLNNYVRKNPNYFGYGLKNPNDWEAIRNGTRGVPAVLSREEQKLVTRKRKAESLTPIRNKKMPKIHPEVWAHYQPASSSSYGERVMNPSAICFDPVYSEALQFHEQYYYYNTVVVPYDTRSFATVEEDVHYEMQEPDYGMPESKNYMEYRMDEAQCVMQEAQYGMQEAGCGTHYVDYRIEEAQYEMKEAQCGIEETQCGMNEAQYRMKEAQYSMHDYGMKEACCRINDPCETQSEAKLPLLSASFCEEVLATPEPPSSLQIYYNDSNESPYSDVQNYDKCHYPYDAVHYPYYHNLPIDTYAGEF